MTRAIFQGLTADQVASTDFQALVSGCKFTNGEAGGTIAAEGGRLFLAWEDGSRRQLATPAALSQIGIDVDDAKLATSRAKVIAPAMTETEPEKVARIAALLAKTDKRYADSFIRTMGYRTAEMAAADRAAGQAEQVAAARTAREAQLKQSTAVAIGGIVPPAKIDVPAGQEARFARLQAIGKALSGRDRSREDVGAVQAPPGAEARLAQLQAVGRAASR